MEDISFSRTELIEEVVFFGNETDYPIISNLIGSYEWTDSDKNSESDLDSGSDMDVDQEFKKVGKISMQEEKDREIFIQMFHQSTKYQNSLQIYNSRKLSWSESKIWRIFKHFKLYNDFPEDKRSLSPNRPSKKLEMKHVISIVNKIEDDPTLSTKKLINLLKSEFDLDVGKTTILKCLKRNGYSYKSPKLKLKNEEPQRQMRENWCLRHINDTNFYDIFFTDETTFYLDNPAGAKWLKDKDNFIYSKNKGRKIGAWGAINACGKTSLYLFEENFKTENFLKILSEALKEMREIKNSETIFLQMDNARYHWTKEALEFYHENNIKLIDWPSYSGDLNPIENVWALMKVKLEGRKFTTMTSLKNELYNIWGDIEIETIEKISVSIYNRIDDCLTSKGGLINY